MRRAMRHAELLGAKEPLMWRLVPSLVREMGQAYPELHRAEGLITETLKLEEMRFRKTLERGLAILDEASKSLKKGDMFDGVTAFTLYDTYGFPLDLTQDALKPRGIGVDIASFTDAMERQREKARASWAGSGEAADEAVWFTLREKHGGTEFLGYETESAEGVVVALVRDGKEVAALQERRKRCGRSQPDAVLRRVRRAGRRYRRDDAATACASRSPTRKSGPATCSCISARSSRAPQSRRLRSRSMSIMRGAAPSGKIIRRPICCTKRCGRCSAITWRRKARWSRPTGCASTSPIPSR